MSFRPTAIAEDEHGQLFAVIDDPGKSAALLVPMSFDHRRVINRRQLANEFTLHPARSDCLYNPEGETER